MSAARNPFALPAPHADRSAGLLARPGEAGLLLATMIRGGRVALIGRRGMGRRTAVSQAETRAPGLNATVRRVDLTRMTSWLEPALVLAEQLVDDDGGLDDDATATPHALRLYRSDLWVARERDDTGRWCVSIQRPAVVRPDRWPWVAFHAVLEETARRTVARGNKLMLVLEGVEALAAAPTEAGGGRRRPRGEGAETPSTDATRDGAMLATGLDQAAEAKGDGTFALVLVGAGATAREALGVLAPTVADVRCVGALPRSEFAKWLQERFERSGVEADPPAVDALLDAAGAVPHYVRQLAGACWDDLAASGAQAASTVGGAVTRLTWSAVVSAADRLARADDADYAALWTSLPLTQRIALRVIQRQDGRGVTSNGTTTTTGLPTSTLQRAVQGLVAKGVLWRELPQEPERRARLRFANPWFGRWVGLRMF